MSYAALSLVGLAGNALAQTNALLLDGSNDVVHVAHNASLNTLPLTVTAWFRTTRDTPEPHGVLSKYSFASIDGYSMTMANGQLTAIYGNGSGYLFNGGLLNSGPVADGFWHHVAMVVTTNGGAMYLDGDLVDSNGWTGASGATTTTAPLLFGNFATFTNACFDGQLDEVAIWSRALGASDVQYLKHRRLNGSESGLTGWWTFNESGGTTATNSAAGGGLSGILSNGASRVSSTAPVTLSPVSGTAVLLDGTDDHVVVQHASDLDAYPLTLTAWVQTTDDQANFDGIISKYLISSLNGYSMFLYGGAVRAWYFGSATDYIWDGGLGLDSGFIADGQWHHIAFIVDSAGGRLLVDGVETDTMGWTGTPGACTTLEALQIGHYSDFTNYPYTFSGHIDEAAVWSRAFSNADISASMNRPLTGGETNLLAYWRFDEGTGTTAADASGNGHTGSLTNGPLWRGSLARLGDGSLHVAPELRLPAFTSPYMITGISGHDGFPLASGARVRRYHDFGTAPASTTAAVAITYSLENSSGAPMTITATQTNYSGALDSYNAFASMSGMFTATNSFTHTPTGQLDTVNDLYKAAQSLTYNAALAETNRTADTRLYHFNGKLFFGSALTWFSDLATDPAITNDAAPTHLELLLPVAVNGGYWPSNATHFYGDGTGLQVEFYANGDTLYYIGAPIAVSGPVPDLLVISNVTAVLTNIILNGSGVTADLGLRMPAGFGCSVSRSNRTLRSEVSFSGIQLTDALLPADFIFEITPGLLGGSELYCWQERMPVWMQAASVFWYAYLGEFHVSPSANHFVREPELAFVTSTGVIAKVGQPQRNGNDHYFRETQPAGDVVVRAFDSDGSRADASLTINTTNFTTHFPSRLTLAPTPGGTLTFSNSILDRSASSLTQAVAVATTFYRDCPSGDCPASTNGPGALSFTPDGNTLRFTPDGGLVANGTVASVPLNWGSQSGGLFTHSTSNFTAAALLTGGYFLPGNDANAAALGNDSRAAGMLLTGFESPGNSNTVERPLTAGYDAGLADYPGLNFRVGTDGANAGHSYLAGQASGWYPLRGVSKYYARLGGVSGRHQAMSFPSAMTLYGFPFDFDGFGLAFLDNINIDARVGGSLDVPYPSDFTIAFENLRFGCKGQLADAKLPPNEPDKTLDYWATTFTPLGIEFRQPTNVVACAPPDKGFLVLGIRTTLPLVPGAVQGIFGFCGTNGNLVSASDGVPGIDSRLVLPTTLQLKGPANTTYRLSTATKAYFNRFVTNSAPEGFVSFAGKLDLPFFEDMKTHVHVIPGQPTSGLSLMGGWPASDGSGIGDGWGVTTNTFFNSQSFDAANRGYPTNVANVADYRNNTGNSQYHPRAQKVWLDILKFDDPLSWSPTTKSFAPFGEAPSQQVVVVTVQHRIKTLTAQHAEMTFGAELSLPKFNAQQMLLDELEAQTAVFESISNAVDDATSSAVDATKLVEAVNALDELVGNDIANMIGDTVDEAFEPVANAIYAAIKPAYEGATTGLTNAADRVAQGQAALCTFFSSDSVIDEGLAAMNNATGVLGQVASSISNALAEADDGVTSLIDIIKIQQPENKRTVIAQIVTKLVVDNESGNPPFATLGPLLLGTLADDLVDVYLPQLETAYAEVERQLNDAHSQLLAARAQVNAGGELFNELSAATANAGAIDDIEDALREALCTQFQGMPDVTGNLFADQSEEAIKQRIRQALADQFLGSKIPDKYRFLLKSRFGESRGIFRESLDQVLANVNTTIREMLDHELSNTFNNVVTDAIGPLNGLLSGTQVKGYARINGDTLEELHLDGQFRLKLYDPDTPLGFDGFLDIHGAENGLPGRGCRPPGKAKVEVIFGSKGTPGSGFASGTDVGLQGRFSLDGLTLLGVGGDVTLGGSKQFSGFEAKDPHLGFNFGMEGNYLGGNVAGDVNGIKANVLIFVGSACNLKQLGFSDPDYEEVLADHLVDTNAPITGYYFVSDGTFPLEKLLGIPPTCALSLQATGGTGFYALLLDDDPLDFRVGIRQRYGLKGEFLCLVELSGDVVVIGDAGLSNTFTPVGSVYGRATLGATIGVCPYFCETYSETFRLIGTVKADPDDPIDFDYDL